MVYINLSEILRSEKWNTRLRPRVIIQFFLSHLILNSIQIFFCNLTHTYLVDAMLFLYIWLLAAVFMTKGIIAEDISDYFSMLDRANAECDDDQIDQMDQYIEDCLTLANSFISAMGAALKQDDGGQDGINGIVARRLFTVWFGIEFGGALGEDPAPTAGTEAIWEAMQSNVNILPLSIALCLFQTIQLPSMPCMTC